MTKTYKYVVEFYKPKTDSRVYLAAFDKEEDAKQFKAMRDSISKYSTYIEYREV